MVEKDMKNMIEDFFGVITRKQTYLNLTYLLFSFPLGTAYFIFLMTGLSMGLSLSITLIGIPILLLMLVAWWELASFERQLAIWLLGINIPPMEPRKITDQKMAEKLKGYIMNPVTWKGLVFLFIKFPLGIFTLIVSFTLIALTITMIAVPFIYKTAYMDLGAYQFDSPEIAIVIMFGGLLLGVISLHIMNGLAKLSGILAYHLLGSTGSAVTDENDYTYIDDVEIEEDAEYVESDEEDTENKAEETSDKTLKTTEKATLLKTAIVKAPEENEDAVDRTEFDLQN